MCVAAATWARVTRKWPAADKGAPGPWPTVGPTAPSVPGERDLLVPPIAPPAGHVHTDGKHAVAVGGARGGYPPAYGGVGETASGGRERSGPSLTTGSVRLVSPAQLGA